MTTDIKIESGIPFTGTARVVRSYPYSQMQVNDSFFVKDIKPVSLSNMNAYQGRKNRAKYSYKREGEGFRVWRLA